MLTLQIKFKFMIYTILIIFGIVWFIKYWFSPKPIISNRDKKTSLEKEYSHEKIFKDAKHKRKAITYTDPNGYLRFNDSRKLVHRWVMEKRLGRKLYSEEIIHHKDGNKRNNDISNLTLFTDRHEHDKYHRNQLRNYGTWYETIPEYSYYKKFSEHNNNTNNG